MVLHAPRPRVRDVFSVEKMVARLIRVCTSSSSAPRRVPRWALGVAGGHRFETKEVDLARRAWPRRALRFAERIVVDSGASRDRTREVAKGGRRAGHRSPGVASSATGRRRRCAFKHATSEWILNLDADERLSPELAAQVPAAVERADVGGYQLRYQTELFGRTLRFGGLSGHETHLTRLFRRERGRMCRALGARGRRGGGARRDAPGPRAASLVRLVLRVPHQARRLHLPRRPGALRRGAALLGVGGGAPWAFFRRYVLQLGVLDGFAGFTHAALAGFYDFLKEAKLQDVERLAAKPPARGDS